MVFITVGELYAHFRFPAKSIKSHRVNKAKRYALPVMPLTQKQWLRLHASPAPSVGLESAACATKSNSLSSRHEHNSVNFNFPHQAIVNM